MISNSQPYCQVALDQRDKWIQEEYASTMYEALAAGPSDADIAAWRKEIIDSVHDYYNCIGLNHSPEAIQCALTYWNDCIQKFKQNPPPKTAPELPFYVYFQRLSLIVPNFCTTVDKITKSTLAHKS